MRCMASNAAQPNNDDKGRLQTPLSGLSKEECVSAQLLSN
jgi:hypothetical protein